MKLNEIPRPEGNKRKKPRKGRGPGSGTGKTAGRGEKGQKARSGAKFRPWFEGGQMPVNRRLPKRGFVNLFRNRFQVVNLRDLERVGDVTEVDAQVLYDHGVIGSPLGPVKLLADGQVSRAYTITVDRASKTAVDAVQAAGGQVNIKS